jgi:hypothetical protein
MIDVTVIADGETFRSAIDARTAEEQNQRIVGQRLEQNLHGYSYARVLEGAGRPGLFCAHDVKFRARGTSPDVALIDQPRTSGRAPSKEASRSLEGGDRRSSNSRENISYTWKPSYINWTQERLFTWSLTEDPIPIQDQQFGVL